jgi:cytochrome c oxidase subunit 3
MTDAQPALAHHFEDIHQQREAAELGMWLFLVTECMLFGGLFLAYLVYRGWYPAGFAAASHAMDVTLGTINTAVLLTSSLTMALAVQSIQAGRRRSALTFLPATLLLGSGFLAIKTYEYYHKWDEHLVPFGGLPFSWIGSDWRGAQMFFSLYFVMTGLHAVHMMIGVALLFVLIVKCYRRPVTAQANLAHNSGLYWHFVDLVWVYLFPFFYLVAARAGATEGGHG